MNHRCRRFGPVGRHATETHPSGRLQGGTRVRKELAGSLVSVRANAQLGAGKPHRHPTGGRSRDGLDSACQRIEMCRMWSHDRGLVWSKGCRRVLRCVTSPDHNQRHRATVHSRSSTFLPAI